MASRYGAWNGGPDPLAPPYDIREALDEIGDDVLAGMSPRSALNRLLRRGEQSQARKDKYETLDHDSVYAFESSFP